MARGDDWCGMTGAVAGWLRPDFAGDHEFHAATEGREGTVVSRLVSPQTVSEGEPTVSLAVGVCDGTHDDVRLFSLRLETQDERVATGLEMHERVLAVGCVREGVGTHEEFGGLEESE